MITCTIPYDVSECTLLLYSLSERLSASFHVIVGHPIDSRLVEVHLIL